MPGPSVRGTILRDLADASTGGIPEDTNQLMKFHGVYSQDDRDLRNQRRKEGKEKAFIFMARVRVPGGVCTPQQWLELDRLADRRVVMQVGLGDLAHARRSARSPGVQNRAVDGDADVGLGARPAGGGLLADDADPDVGDVALAGEQHGARQPDVDVDRRRR